MITSNVLRRVFRLRYGKDSGTAFVIDVARRQYLVTAHHLLEGISVEGDALIDVHLEYEQDWKRVPVEVVGTGEEGIDVAVLAPRQRLVGEGAELASACDGMALGLDVFLLGFPFGFNSICEELNGDFPVPLLRKGILSAVMSSSTGQRMLVVDALNHEGFSGGPVVFRLPGETDYQVAGIISGYRAVREPVYQGDEKTDYHIRWNSGLVLAYGIEHALDLIAEKPIGFEVT